VFLLCFIFVSFLEANVSAHCAFLSCSVQCHLLSIFCTCVIEQINVDDDDNDDDSHLLYKVASFFKRCLKTSHYALQPQSTNVL